MLKVGDVVVVKPDVFDPDFKIPLGGWQGRITSINPSQTVLRIDWDSITLQQMPPEVLERCHAEGLYWHFMSLYTEEVELTTARDTEKEVAAVIRAIERGEMPTPVFAGATHINGNQHSTTVKSTRTIWQFPRPDYVEHLW